MQHRQLPDGWDKDLPTFPADPKGMAGRIASSKVLNAIAPNVPWLIGGSADLTPSTKTRIEAKDAGDFSAGTTAGGTSTSASASWRWGRASTAWR
jgi:transketolase